MKDKALTIKSVERFKVPPRWLFVKITTTDGFAGWGEPIVEGRADTVRAAVEEFSSALIGRPAHRIDEVAQRMAAVREAVGPAVGIAVDFHGRIRKGMAKQINACIQETSLGIHYNEAYDLLDYLVDPGVFAFEDGYVKRPERPGLGIAVNEERVREAVAQGHDWKSPVWRTPDGAVTEW